MTATSEELPTGSTLDALTGLPNRQLLRQHLEEAIRRTQLDEHIAALLVLGIDRFKLVNAAIDYEGGDLLLKMAAERLRSCLRERDSLTRHGVDEFAVVLNGMRNARDVAAVGEKLARAMALPFEIRGNGIVVTCSIGISLYPQDGADAASLLRYANMALDRARELGRNNTQFFSSELNERAQERLRLEAALRATIEKEDLSLCYQPLADLQTGRMTGLEAISRWVHPEFGLIDSARFLAIAGECGLLDRIGAWTLRTACADMHRWAAQGQADVHVAINISARQFRDPLLADKIGATLAEAGVAPQRLCLEIPENALMQDPAASETTLQHLQALGVDLALDDFGSGFSSLNYLKRFPFKKLKIDRAFVANVASSSDAGAVAKAVISMAHSLGIRVAAGGVDNEQQCDYLRLNMCDEIQGALFSEALPGDAIAAFMAREPRLPAHLLRLNKPPRTLLLVDDEVNILSALKRLLRGNNYKILTAASGQEGLDLLKINEVDVIVSDQRMPGITGVEFLRKAKEIRPDTVRIVLSGYAELQSVTGAVNEGAIYKFLMKPWDDAQLREHIDEAFRRKEMADENRRLALEVSTANFELAAANRRLEEVLKQQQQQISRDEASLDVVREALQRVPLPMLGLDEDDFIVFSNAAALALFAHAGAALGSDARTTMPELLQAAESGGEVRLEGHRYAVISHHMGQHSESRGKLIILTRQPE
jgi:diguanylate cyclase (GGDEF)-like protein